MKYIVAVIIPTLNEERFIRQCLDSIIFQSFPFSDMDVMVVDGGSNDRTCSIVNDYQGKYQNIRLLDNPDRVQSAAFNIGVDASDAPYVIRLDAHTWYEQKYIEKCLDTLKEDEQRGNAGGRWIVLPYDDSLWAQTNAILNCNWFGIGGASFRVGAEAGNVDSVPYGAFPRKVIREVGGMNEKLARGEDNEYNSRIRKAGYKVFFNPEIVSSYYARPTFGSSCRQMFYNGISIGHLFYVDREAIGLRHLVPFLFVSCIMTGWIISAIYFPFSYLIVAVISVYLVCDLVAAVSAGIRHGWKYLFPLAVMFPSIHFSYGCGTIAGLVSGRKFKRG